MKDKNQARKEDGYKNQAAAASLPKCWEENGNGGSQWCKCRKISELPPRFD